MELIKQRPIRYLLSVSFKVKPVDCENYAVASIAFLGKPMALASSTS